MPEMYRHSEGFYILTIEGMNCTESADEALDWLIDYRESGVRPENAIGLIEDPPSWITT